MSDPDNDDDFSEDESDGETEEERERREDEEEIEDYIVDNPLVKVGGDTYDRRTVTEIKVREGVTEIEEVHPNVQPTTQIFDVVLVVPSLPYLDRSSML